MLDEVDFTGAIDIPKIDGKHIERGVDLTGGIILASCHVEMSVYILDIDFFIRELIAHNQTNTWWGRDRSSVLNIVRAEKAEMRKNHPPCHRIHTCELGWAAAPPLMTKYDPRIHSARAKGGRRAVAYSALAGMKVLGCDPLRVEVGQCIFVLRRSTWWRTARETGRKGRWASTDPLTDLVASLVVGEEGVTATCDPAEVQTSQFEHRRTVRGETVFAWANQLQRDEIDS